MELQNQQQDPVHMDPDGQWYFYDATWANRYGPFLNDAQAREKLTEYAAWLSSQQHTAHQAEQPQEVAGQPSETECAVAEYLRLRDYKAELGQSQKAAMSEVDDSLSQMESWFLGKMQEMGVDSFKVAAGTVYTAANLRASIGDKDALSNHIRQTGEVELLQSRVSTTVLKEWMERNNGACPPGVSVSTERVVNVRRK